MAVGGVDDNGVDSCGNEGVDTLHRVGCHTHAGCHAEASEGVLAGIGFVLGLGDVLVCYQTHEFAVGVDNGQFFYLMRLQYVGSFFEACGLRGGDEVFGSHYFIDEALRVALEA